MEIAYLYRMAVLVMLPFLFGAFVLQHSQMMYGQMLNSPQEIRNTDDISYSFSHNGSDLAVPTSVNSIFPLANYLGFAPFVNHYSPEICFQDNDSYVLLSDGTRYDPEFSWTVDFNNKTALHVEPDSMNCTEAKEQGTAEFRWYVTMAIPSNDSRFRGNVTFVPQTIAFPRMTMDYGLLQGLVMIPVCYLFLWYPAAGIWKKIHKGLLEQ